VRDVTNVHHPKTKESLSLFFLGLEPKENNKSIFELQTLLNTHIQVETPKPHYDIIQCKRCQGLGHTQTYCTLPWESTIIGTALKHQTQSQHADYVVVIIPQITKDVLSTKN